jgi:hypothetical protein
VAPTSARGRETKEAKEAKTKKGKLVKEEEEREMEVRAISPTPDPEASASITCAEAARREKSVSSPTRRRPSETSERP